MDAITIPKAIVPKATLSKAVLGMTEEDGDAGYVRDGLVFHLDGIDKGPNPGAWTDLIGGIPFTPEAGTTSVFGDNYVVMKGIAPQDAYVNVLAKDGTIECAFRNDEDATRNIIIFHNRIRGSIAIGSTSGTVIASMAGANITHAAWTPIRKKGDVAMSFSARNFLLNGKISTAIGAHDYWIIQGDSLWVGSFPYAARMYSIRIYDRHLTEDEILHNQAVDKRRFGLHFEEPISTLEYVDEYPDTIGCGQRASY